MPDLTDPGPTDPLAAALARLRPAAAAAEKPAFLFRAGQASRDAAVRRWQWLTGVAVALLVGSWAVGLAVVAEALRRTETAEAQLLDARAAVASATVAEPPAAAPASSPPKAFPVPDAPTPPPAPAYDPDPTPEQLADALRLRNDILTAGLTLLPPSRAPTGNDLRRALPGGVFATPRHEPRKPAPVFPPDDDDNE